VKSHDFDFRIGFISRVEVGRILNTHAVALRRLTTATLAIVPLSLSFPREIFTNIK
jgi:hypothetical protein